MGEIIRHKTSRIVKGEIQRIIEKEREAVLASETPERELLDDHDLVRMLTEQGLTVKAIEYHRTRIGIKCVSQRWKDYQREIERNRKNGKKQKSK